MHTYTQTHVLCTYLHTSIDIIYTHYSHIPHSYKYTYVLTYNYTHIQIQAMTLKIQMHSHNTIHRHPHIHTCPHTWHTQTLHMCTHRNTDIHSIADTLMYLLHIHSHAYTTHTHILVLTYSYNDTYTQNGIHLSHQHISVYTCILHTPHIYTHKLMYIHRKSEHTLTQYTNAHTHSYTFIHILYIQTFYILAHAHKFICSYTCVHRHSSLHVHITYTPSPEIHTHILHNAAQKLTHLHIHTYINTHTLTPHTCTVLPNALAFSHVQSHTHWWSQHWGGGH